MIQIWLKFYIFQYRVIFNNKTLKNIISKELIIVWLRGIDMIKKLSEIIGVSGFEKNIINMSTNLKLYPFVIKNNEKI